MGFFDILAAPFKLVAKGASTVFHAGESLVHDVVSVPKSIVHDVTQVPVALVHEGAGVIKGGQDMVKSVAGSAEGAVTHVADSAEKLGSNLGKSLSMPLLVGGAAVLGIVLLKR